MAHRLFVISYFALPILAALLATKYPLPGVLMLLGGLLFAIYALHRRALLLASGATLRGRSAIWPYEELVQTIEALRREADEGQLHGLEKNVRLLGLHEIWSSVSQSENLNDVFDGVLGYLQKRSGYRELALLRIEPHSGELSGSWASPMNDSIHLRRVRWALGGIGGGLGEVLIGAKSLSVRDAARRPLVLLNGEEPERTSDCTSYVVVPLLSPLPKPECFEHKHLHRANCPAFEAVPHRSYMPGAHRSPARGACMACRHYPLHGVLLVSDAQRDRMVGEDDQRQLEALASSIGAVLDQARHYRESAEAEEFRNQVLDAMNNGLVTTDPRGRIVYANRRAHEMSGLGPEMLGAPLDEVVEILSSPGALRAALFDGMEAIHLDGFLKLRDASGHRSHMPIRINMGPYSLGASGLRGAVCVFADHSGVKAMEEEIRHLDTLAAVGRFASSMAHEIRNPLGGISAGIHYMNRHEQFPQELRENVDVIEGEIRRLDRIIKNLLEVARPDQMQLTRTEPTALVKRTVRSLEPWLKERSIELELEVDEELPSAYVDGEKLQQVLINLLKNAAEAAHTETGVRLVARSIRTADLGTDFDLPDAGGLLIAVEDEGEGILPEDIPRLFEPFFTRKSSGTGLGLYVCHNLVQRHGGVLRVESAPGIGTRMTVLLPNAPIRTSGAITPITNETALAGGIHETAHSPGR